MSNWIRAAESALSQKGTPDPSLEVVPVVPPPLVDASFVRAVLSPFLAGFMWAATAFRELQASQPFDPLALFLRFLALALSVRALLLLGQLAGRLRLRLALRRHGLVLAEEGLLYRGPVHDVVLLREDILDVRERGRGRGRAGRRFAEVYLVAHPRSGRSHVALPPVFDATPGMLSERLMRWLGPRQERDEPQAPPAADPQLLASKLWESAAAGEALPDVVAIRHGSAWLQRGPYASVLLGVAVLESFVRLPAENQAAAGHTMPLVLVGALIIVPISWVLLTRAQLKPRRGLALVLTPAELLLRLRAGLTRIAWSQLLAAEIETRSAWTILLGAHESRSLVFRRRGAAELRYHESFVGAPLEVVCALADAYRKGLIEAPAPRAT